MPAPFAGEEFTFTNPDGSQIRVRGWGNQFYAVFEALDGYTVVRDPETGWFEYAGLSADGTELVPTGGRVGAAEPGALGVPRGVRVTRAAAGGAAAAATGRRGRSRWEVRRQERRDALRAQADAGIGTDAAPPPHPAPTGQVTGLCVPVQFPDLAGTITRQQIDDFCNQSGYTAFGNNGSVHDYYVDNSAGTLQYRNVVVDYYTAAHPRSYYTDETIPYTVRAQELIGEALVHLKGTGFDFTQLSSDDGGFVYALNVFYAGDATNNWSEGLWPHQSFLATPFEGAPGRTLNDYQITDIGSQLTLRTFCHENGHMVCGFPDLYDYGGESAGVGNYCLMAYGASNPNPVEINAYLKNAAGWTTHIADLDDGMVASVQAGTNDFLLHRKNATEYFILENRQRTGRDAALPDAGLVIWHVDETGSNSNEEMTPALHYELALEQSDGHFDLEHFANYGDTTDLYGAPTGNVFDSASTPNSTWWDGTASGLDIRAVSAPAQVATVRTRGAVQLVIHDFGYVAGGWRVDRHPRFVADLNGDRCADVVGFGDAGVHVALNNGNGTFQPRQLVIHDFGYVAGGWRVDRHPRFLADLRTPGHADVVGFGDAGVYVALNNGDGTFGAVTRVIDDFAYVAGGWRVDRHPRLLAPLRVPGRADIVGFGDAGVYVSFNNGNGTFSAPVTRVVDDFGYVAGGWRVDRHPRFLADLTGDGRADIVGFGDAGVYVSLNQGNGTFGPVTRVVDDFGYVAGGWRVDRHPRFLADLTGDGRADIVGFGDAGVYVSLNQGNGTFGPVTRVVDDFGYVAGGWRVDRHPRFVADLTNDLGADIVGFGDAGVWESLDNGKAVFQAPTRVIDNYGYVTGGWRVDKHPRFVADLTGDGRADIVGFGDAGVYVSLNEGNGAF